MQQTIELEGEGYVKLTVIYYKIGTYSKSKSTIETSIDIVAVQFPLDSQLPRAEVTTPVHGVVFIPSFSGLKPETLFGQ